MSLNSRSTAVVAVVLVLAVAVGCGSSGTTGKTGSKQMSPCGTAMLPAWSPGGMRIAWYGRRWPLPPLHHRGASYTVLRALCTSSANGGRIRNLPHTVCSEHCSGNLREGLDQLYWPQPGLLLYGNDFGIFAIPAGQKPKLIGKKPPEPFSVDKTGDRVAAGSSVCPSCSGPVTILSVPSGAIVGKVGGTQVDNAYPSLSPDGTQVVFARFPANDSGRQLGIWTASADGSRLQRLAPTGGNPLWSPAGDRIAYLAAVGTTAAALRLVSPRGGASTTLVPKIPGALLGWSPDGRYIAFSDLSGKLDVVDVHTGTVRKLLKLQPPFGPSSIAWSPDSRQLLVVWRPPAGAACESGLWRVPVSGGAPHLVRGCGR